MCPFTGVQMILIVMAHTVFCQLNFYWYLYQNVYVCNTVPKTLLMYSHSIWLRCASGLLHMTLMYPVYRQECSYTCIQCFLGFILMLCDTHGICFSTVTCNDL